VTICHFYLNQIYTIKTEIFVDKINMERCIMLIIIIKMIYIILKQMKVNLMKGLNVNKKSCIYKRDAIYDKGEWTKSI
jgi:hypothetical protein